MRFGSLISVWTALLSGSMLFGACDGRFARIEAREVRVERSSWDTLSVQATFIRDPFIGTAQPIPADSLRVTVFRADYDTLYHGTPGTIFVADEQLFSDERLLVEVCGAWQRRTACDQVGIRASHKRAQLQSQVDFPLASGEFGIARYRFEWQRERQGYADSVWSTLPTRVTPDARLRVYVPGASSAVVEVPVQPGTHRLDMRRRPGFRDFRYDIQSALLDKDSTVVFFDLYGRIAPQRTLLARDSVMVRARTLQERKEELVWLVEQAGNVLLEELQGRLAFRRAFVFINEWSYASLERTYDAEVELQWQDGFRQQWSDVTLRLSVRFDGSRGVARLVRASSRAHDKWFSAWPDSTVFLEAL